MSKLDPKLEYLLKKGRESQVHRSALLRPEDAEVEGEESLPQEVKILLKFTGEISELEALGFQPEAVAGNIASGRVNMADLPAIAALDSVIKIEMSRPLHPELNLSALSIKANAVHTGTTPFKGAGVIVGVIDTGIDYTNKGFMTPDDKSRILFLWDQRPPSDVTPAPPAGFTDGIEYTKATIDAALLQEEPFDTLKHKDKDGHGSHVAGIAAGNGREGGTCEFPDTIIGIAPEADLIIVKLSSDNEELGEAANLTAAISYIFGKATGLGKPAVINISMGDNIGAHDGTSLVEQFIDATLNTAGRAVIKSAGNEGDSNHHATGTITAEEESTAEIEFTVPAGQKDNIIIDIWYEGSDRFDVSLSPPDELPSDDVSPGNLEEVDLENNNVATINSQLNDPDNHDNRIYIEIKKGTRRNVEAGRWTLNLHATTLVSGVFHCWIERDTLAHFRPPYRSQAATISVPGTANNVISVGSYADRGIFTIDELSSSSSRGPTRDGRTKPEIVAPGDSILSVRSSTRAEDNKCTMFCCGRYVPLSGTSMAAPHLTGVVALMLQKNPGLTISDIRTHLLDHPQTTSEMGTLPNNSWGWGIVDAEAVVAAVPAVGTLLGPASIPPTSAAQPSLIPPSTSLKPGLGTATPFAPISLEHLARIQSDILQTSTGQLYMQIVRKHFYEVRSLVNNNRRVGAVWVRGGGPTMIRRLLQAIYNPDEPIPSIIDGKSVVESLNRFFAILRRYGSPALLADLDQYGEVIFQFDGLSYNQFLAQLR